MFASLLIQAVTLRDSLRTAPIGSFRFPAFAGCAGRSPCEMRDILDADSGLQEKFGDIFAHNPNNFEMSLLGWNEIHMKDPFDSSSTGAENRIFMLPPSDSKCYVKSRNYVVPYGWKFVPKAYSEGSMHSALVARTVRK
jgi:hypothetical protein